MPEYFDVISDHAAVVLWCGLALFCGGLIKGTLGVGTPLLTVPMLALVMPAQSAVTLMAMPILVANLWQAGSARNLAVVIRRFFPAAIALLFGTFIGTRILSSIQDKWLLLVVGVIVILFTGLQTSSRKLSITPKQVMPAGVVFGVLSGVIGGISSMFGPMLIVYLVSIRDMGKDDFVNAISFLYVCAVVPWTFSLLFEGLLAGALLAGSLAAVLPVTAGMILGRHLRGRISEIRFQRLMLAVLLISGSSMIWQSIHT